MLDTIEFISNIFFNGRSSISAPSLKEDMYQCSSIGYTSKYTGSSNNDQKDTKVAVHSTYLLNTVEFDAR